MTEKNNKFESVNNNYNSTSMNKDINFLDSRIKYENDKSEFSSCHSQAMTRESREKRIHCFSGYSCQSTNMTKGDNTSNTTKGDNTSSTTKGDNTSNTTRMISQSGRIPDPVTLGHRTDAPHSITLRRGTDDLLSVTLGRSETKTRGSRPTNAYASDFRFAQSGRSMVEMLGVLAVVGVLSIGGITGYSYGMDKYRANETINELTTRALGLMQQIGSNKITELNMEMGYKTKLGYPIDAWMSERDPNYFYIAIGDIPPEVCRQILKQNWTLPTDILLGGTDFSFYQSGKNHLGVCDTTDLQMDFEFYLDFGKSGTVPDIYVEETPWPDDFREICNNPDKPLQDGDTCYPCSETKHIYVGKYGKCQSVCPNRRLFNNYFIIPCGTGEYSEKKLMDVYGNCHACSDSSSIRVGNGDCTEVCGNRIKEGDDCKIK